MNVKEFADRAVRHGEIMLIPIDTLPGELTEVQRGRRVIVGHSETGQHHVAVCESNDLRLLKPTGADSNDLYLEVTGVAQIEHLKPYDRHETKTLQPGIYFVNTKEQFDYFLKRQTRVMD